MAIVRAATLATARHARLAGADRLSRADARASPAIDAARADVVLDRIQDPGNVGGVLRSAAAFGFTQVIALAGTAALWSPKVARAGMGAHFGLRLIEGAAGTRRSAALDVAAVRHQLARRAAASATVALPWPCAWVFGHEGRGVAGRASRGAAGRCSPSRSRAAANRSTSPLRPRSACTTLCEARAPPRALRRIHDEQADHATHVTSRVSPRPGQDDARAADLRRRRRRGGADRRPRPPHARPHLARPPTPSSARGSSSSARTSSAWARSSSAAPTTRWRASTSAQRRAGRRRVLVGQPRAGDRARGARCSACRR